ncbi:MAG TPA: hotdog fold thioesterase [Trueperaceae bacterium]|nr:hotdog fold thioesterase [Trueperaceae bacterium]
MNSDDGPPVTEQLADLKASWPNSLMATLGIELGEVSGERVTATMPVTPRHHQPHGIMHGGASVALAETVASVGATVALRHENQRVVGLEINANHVGAVRSGTVTATGTPIHKGRSTQVWAVEIRDDGGRLVCVSRCTLAVLDG